MYSERLKDALDRAAAPTLKRIREDSERLPEPLSRLVAYIGEHLFDQDLTGKKARAAVGIRSNSLPATFLVHLKTTLGGYIKVARVEIARRLLRLGEFEVGSISMAVGYKSDATFRRAHKDLTSERPSEVKPGPDEPGSDFSTWCRAWERKLEPEVARDLIDRLAELYGEAGERIVIDGVDYFRIRAEEIWGEIRDLAPEEQRRRLRRYEFHSEALFDLLREKSRQKGRRDRRQGIHLAELALVSLESCDDFFGERIHDLRALGHACVGNAHRLARDFPAADAAFERAEEEWKVPRRDKDSLIWARILDRKVALRICQRSYGEARRLVERARDLYQQSGDLRGEARLLLQLAAIHGYAGEQEKCIEILQEATNLVDADRDPHLAYVLYGSLASILAKVGRFSSAAKKLANARAQCKRLNHPWGALKIQWIDAEIQQGTGDQALAERLFLTARIGYAESEELNSLGIISLDLAIFYAEQGRWSRVLAVASEAVPVLGSLRLHEETLSAVALLGRAVEAGDVSSSLLRQVREKVLQDPLAGISF